MFTCVSKAFLQGVSFTSWFKRLGLAALTAYIILGLFSRLSAQNYMPLNGIEIIYQAPVSKQKLHIYKRVPRPNSASVVSAALALASLQTSDQRPNPANAGKGFLWFAQRRDEPWARSGPSDGCTIDPEFGTIAYQSSSNFGTPSTDVPDDLTIAKLACRCVAQLGIERSQMKVRAKRIQTCDLDKAGDSVTNGICSRGIVLTRCLDGIEFYAGENFVSSGFILDRTSAKGGRQFFRRKILLR